MSLKLVLLLAVAALVVWVVAKVLNKLLVASLAMLVALALAALWVAERYDVIDL